MTAQVENLRQTYDRTYDNLMTNHKILFVIWPQINRDVELFVWRHAVCWAGVHHHRLCWRVLCTSTLQEIIQVVHLLHTVSRWNSLLHTGLMQSRC